ncbi:hypothetical protein KQ874_01895 [Mycoplasma sp. ES3157-GEN-MYC]|uniref:Uncharacterized protein n=1 Tax=Mycoplasma miroungigenitalium TaxID=754515 RepID=A0A6M4JBY2_9MOLU|nr:hypothetical protein [Mycoplasma miroungigenitalium]MBU4690441.1 hypothetical protein [Mycoplasma miroungigenitalium]MBU4691708.1 hypothetical protein [Mycoplasma miroungigenitalium]QJR43536.1 hypothetical protein HLA87_01900 [Mycoplasma miroungigenitalium]
MDQNTVLGFLNLTSAEPISAWFTWLFGMTSLIFTVLIGLPQLIHLIKTKETSPEVKYYSFWLFFSGIVGWMILGSWDVTNPKMLATAYSNMAASYIFSLTLFFLYLYSPDKSRRKHAWLVLLISMGIAIASTVLSLFGIVQDRHMNPKLMVVAVTIFPMLTTFSFLPSVIRSFENRKFDGMSVPMLICMVCVNFFWLLYWVTLAINRGDLDSNILSAMMWQTISFLIYFSQFILVVVSHLKSKKIKRTA